MDQQVPHLSEQDAEQDPYWVDSYLWRLGLQASHAVADPLAAQKGQGHHDRLVTPGMRRQVLRWLAAVARQFGLALETWCLSVCLLDRFTSLRALHCDCLQLAALTALAVAAKMEEVDPPDLSDLAAATDGAFHLKQFRWMEMVLLSQLGWHLLAPTAAFFLSHLVNSDPHLANAWPHELSRCLLESALCDYQLTLAAPEPQSMAAAVFNAVAPRIFTDGRLLCAPSPADLDESSPASLAAEYAKRVAVEVLTKNNNNNNDDDNDCEDLVGVEEKRYRSH